MREEEVSGFELTRHVGHDVVVSKFWGTVTSRACTERLAGLVLMQMGFQPKATCNFFDTGIDKCSAHLRVFSTSHESNTPDGRFFGLDDAPEMSC